MLVTVGLPDRARVVVIGGGVIGSSVAYHLAHAGWTDVVVLERDRLTSGTTWHAAGLMTCFGSTSETSTAIRLYSRDLYARLEAETGQSTGFRPVGLIEAAADRDRLEEYRRVAAFQRHLGLEVHEISPTEMAERFPWARTDDLLGGFFVPGDGRVNPVDLTMALAKGARALGVRVVEGVAVTDVLTSGGAVTGVRAAGQTIECEYVVNCTGMWARELGERNGVVIPNQAAEHYYLITDTIEGLDPNAPVFEDPSSYGYYREEGGGMMVGLFEPEAAAWRVEGIPSDFSFGTLPADWDRMAPFLEKAMARVPITQEVGIRTFFCGPESFTPDLAPAVGEAPGIRGYFVAAGMNSVGILSAGGLGRVLAHWITTGRPDVDVTGFNVDRFRVDQLEPAYRAARTAEVLGTVYAAHTPGTQLTSARGRLLSPVHDRLVAQGGLLREVSGWEGADWFAGAGRTPEAEPTWGRAPWFEQWEQEHRAVREAVGLMDLSFMAKFRVQGQGAGSLLDRLSAAAVNGDPGVITYTQWLNDDGRIEADLTVTKLDDDDFWVVASDTAHGHVRAWLHRFVDATVSITDVTVDYAQLNVQGPRSRDVLSELTDADLTTEAFGFRSAGWVELAGTRVLLARITYLGELGYELYVPAGDALRVHDAIQSAGTTHGLRPVGLKALASLRMEKAYRDYGHDIDNTDCPLEAGLGFALALDKPADFIGREAVLARQAANAAAGGMARRMVQVRLLDPGPLLFHAEIVLRDGQPVGYVRAGSYGWTLGSAVGLAMVEGGGQPVTSEWLASGRWEIDVAGTRCAAAVSVRPMYDPTSARVRL
ncbi:FAD dependent oxidoreductase [Intrasporangium calvum DSM 43043]|uniref:FAD dependent oxidoreductase n=1 Tax=Intrasporangium calvum (strain ATCC 23552 / DSM 43043 / JCM 3097 / NBRC 12989 / NCIMB 10167 / NRRL B-3866 / 7 KIP) TaxID=710696 RepID=E6S847_INTC7|nr:FAD dependent oxidoreductase [Intrasporangium calvum DSM 43043]